MERANKKIIALYLIIVLIKIIFSYFVSSPTGFWDEYVYSKIARNFYYYKILSLSQTPEPFYPPLYSIVLSITYLFRDMNLIYFFMKVINALISTLTIIPVYFLSKDFLEEKQRILICILVALLPISFSFSYYILGENLFLPLFYFSIYFIYKSLKENNKKNNILAAIFISLSYLTKELGLILILIYFLSHLAKRIILKEKIEMKNFILAFAIIFLIISPWFIRNYFVFDQSLSGTFGELIKDNVESFLSSDKHKGYYFQSLINWIIIHLIALSISSGIILFFSSFFALKEIKKKNHFSLFMILAIITVLTCIFVLSNNALGPQPDNLPKIFSFYTGRIIMRYLDILVPLIFITGAIGVNNYKKESDKKGLRRVIISSIPFFIISSQLNIDSMFPINNLSLTHFGVINVLINFLINKSISFNSEFNYFSFGIMLIIFSLLPFTALLINKLNFKKLFYLILITNIMILILNFSIVLYKSNLLYYNEQTQLGLWLNENDVKISKIFFDIDDSGNPLENNTALIQIIKEKQYDPQYLSVIAFWLNDDLFFDDIKKAKDSDFIISTKNLSLPLIKETEGIKIYKSEEINYETRG